MVYAPGVANWWRKKAAPPFAGCFGKLPSKGDFIRHHASAPELQALDEWISGTLDHAQASLGDKFRQYYKSFFGLFIFRPPSTTPGEPPERALVGAWAASGDSAGRVFPMVVFGSYDYGELVQLRGAAPLALWSLFTSAYELATQGRKLDAGLFVERVQGIWVPPIDDVGALLSGYETFLRENTVDAFWDTTIRLPETRYSSMERIRSAVEPFRGVELGTTPLSVRCPLHEADAYAVAVWVDLIVRLARWECTLPSVFWTPQGSALVHLGAPPRTTLRELLEPDPDADTVIDLMQPAVLPEMTAKERLGADLVTHLDRRQLPLAEFLSGLGGQR